MKLYHCTPRSREENIDKQGLLPTWAWHTRYYGTTTSEEYQHCPVHLSVDGSFEDFILDLCAEEGEDVVCYEVCGDELVLYPGEDGPGTVAVFQWVKPEWLTKKFYWNGKEYADA